MPIRTSSVRSVFERVCLSSRKRKGVRPANRRTFSFEPLEQRHLLSVLPTVTAMSVSRSAPVYGQSVTLTATVSVVAPNTGTPTGTVDFIDSTTNTNLGTASVANGVAAISTSVLVAGPNALEAVYGGDANFAGSSTSTAMTPLIATVAGNGTCGYSGDGGAATSAQLAMGWGGSGNGGIAVDAAGDIFIADTWNNCIREVHHSTGVITTVAGNGTAGYSGDGGQAAAAELNSPGGVAVDAVGDIFIADTGNNCIREVNSTGVITTVAGNGTMGYNGDGGQATAAELSSPAGVAVDAAGDIFMADTYNNCIREVNPATGIITTVAGNGNRGSSGDGGQATAAKLNYPAGVAADAAGDIFIADSCNNLIREVNHATGVITTVAGSGTTGYGGDGGQATASRLNNSLGVAVDAAGDVLCIADTYDNRVRDVQPQRQHGDY